MTPLRPPQFEHPTPRGASAVLAAAGVLCGAARAGAPRQLLLGKNLGLLSDAADGVEAQLFRLAATELGAKVAQIRPGLTLQSERAELLRTARLLGRLYDGVECQGLAPALVRQMARDAGVPFFDGIATCGHPSVRLAEQLDGAVPLDERRRYVVQAILLEALA